MRPGSVNERRAQQSDSSTWTAWSVVAAKAHIVRLETLYSSVMYDIGSSIDVRCDLIVCVGHLEDIQFSQRHQDKW